MAILDILQFPDRRLRERARAVARVDDAIRQLADDMLETMYDAPGIGLAATQVGDRRRVVVMDVSETHDSPQVLINPEIIALDGEQDSEEGCLSIPGVHDRVLRAETVTVRALDREGASFEFTAQGLHAACVQHEIDHLDGRLFIDHLSQLKRQRIEKKLAKERRRNEGQRSAAG